MGVGAGLYVCDVVKKFTFAISSPDEFLYFLVNASTRMAASPPLMLCSSIDKLIPNDADFN